MAHPYLALRPTRNRLVSHYVVAGSKNPLPLGMGSVNKSEHREGRIHSILPILWFLSVNYNLITLGGKINNWLVVSSKDFPGMFFEGCAIAVVILGFFKRASFIAGVPRVQTTSQTTSNADELRKYKELLDEGIITQEEFDKKKKQLLKK